ncbi:hypothetical protein OIE75_32550 [Streptomyces sp. NBC_01723]|uniref:hypothetical protein n=1 Tax=Streptomyces sp. NBC_01723 TaxID=2975921 RepID=UPI002E336C47|nr:hypothetical protein [Streptomyces sp. NBC_01723]
MTQYSTPTDVGARVLESGVMVLSLGEREVRCPPEATAVWIALRRHGGRTEEAAACLAAAWDESPEDVHVEVMDLARRWCQGGFLRGVT